MQSLGLLLAVSLLGTGICLNTAVLVYFTVRAHRAITPKRKRGSLQSRGWAAILR